MAYQSQAWLALGCQLSVDDGNGNYLPILELKVINGPDEKAATVEVTNQNSQNRRREYIAGLIDPGSLAFPAANYIPDDPSQDGFTGFYAVFNSGQKRNYNLSLPNVHHTQIQLSGIAVSHTKVFDFSREANFGGEVKITGPVSVS